MRLEQWRQDERDEIIRRELQAEQIRIAERAVMLATGNRRERRTAASKARKGLR